jgi:hypothetical protein
MISWILKGSKNGVLWESNPFTPSKYMQKNSNNHGSIKESPNIQKYTHMNIC